MTTNDGTVHTEDVARHLLDWYDKNRRTLPWRDSGASPYHTWVSEIMLQQTRVDTVIPYFERFISSFPDVQTLADAEEEQVLSHWAGLGYYSRARNLHNGAKQVAENGMPSDLKGWLAISGVGTYTAGAICSIALGQSVAAVDGNVERVIARLFSHPGGRKIIAGLIEPLLPKRRCGDFNQALMDLGSSLCTARIATCESCPLAPCCTAATGGDPTQYPTRKKRRKVPTVRSVALACLNERGQLLLVKQPTSRRFAGLYDLPSVEILADESIADTVQRIAHEHLTCDASEMDLPNHTVKHTLTHMHIDRTIVRVALLTPPSTAHYPKLIWDDPSDPTSAVSTLAKKSVSALY